jgi:lysozyme
MKPEVLEHIKKQLIIDEGVRLDVYEDSLGNLTVGVGHLVQEKDQLTFGQVITQKHCDALFAADLSRTIYSCERDIDGWNAFPDEIQEILVNMAYNLGITGLLKFVNTLKFLRNHQYDEAADALIDSRWYTQVGYRSKRIVARLREFEFPIVEDTPVTIATDTDSISDHIYHDLVGKHILCQREPSTAIVEYIILQLSPSKSYIKIGIEGSDFTEWLPYTVFRDIGILEFLDEE